MLRGPHKNSCSPRAVAKECGKKIHINAETRSRRQRKTSGRASSIYIGTARVYIYVREKERNYPAAMENKRKEKGGSRERALYARRAEPRKRKDE